VSAAVVRDCWKKTNKKNEVMLLHAGASGINGAKRFKKRSY